MLVVGFLHWITQAEDHHLTQMRLRILKKTFIDQKPLEGDIGHFISPPNPPLDLDRRRPA